MSPMIAPESWDYVPPWEAFFHDSDYEASGTLFRHYHFAGVAGGLAVEVGAIAPLVGAVAPMAG